MASSMMDSLPTAQDIISSLKSLEETFLSSQDFSTISMGMQETNLSGPSARAPVAATSSSLPPYKHTTAQNDDNKTNNNIPVHPPSVPPPTSSTTTKLYGESGLPPLGTFTQYPPINMAGQPNQNAVQQCHSQYHTSQPLQISKPPTSRTPSAQPQSHAITQSQQQLLQELNNQENKPSKSTSKTTASGKGADFFLVKIWQHLLFNPECQHIITWDADGRFLIIYDTDALMTEIKTKGVCKQKDYDSFARQLRIYRWGRVRQDEAGSQSWPESAKVWKHPYLTRESDINEVANVTRNAPPKPNRAGTNIVKKLEAVTPTTTTTPAETAATTSVTSTGTKESTVIGSNTATIPLDPSLMDFDSGPLSITATNGDVKVPQFETEGSSIIVPPAVSTAVDASKSNIVVPVTRNPLTVNPAPPKSAAPNSTPAKKATTTTTTTATIKPRLSTSSSFQPKPNQKQSQPQAPSQPTRPSIPPAIHHLHCFNDTSLIYELTKQASQLIGVDLVNPALLRYWNKKKKEKSMITNKNGGDKESRKRKASLALGQGGPLKIGKRPRVNGQAGSASSSSSDEDNENYHHSSIVTNPNGWRIRYQAKTHRSQSYTNSETESESDEEDFIPQYLEQTETETEIVRLVERQLGAGPPPPPASARVPASTTASATNSGAPTQKPPAQNSQKQVQAQPAIKPSPVSETTAKQSTETKAEEMKDQPSKEKPVQKHNAAQQEQSGSIAVGQNEDQKIPEHNVNTTAIVPSQSTSASIVVPQLETSPALRVTATDGANGERVEHAFESVQPKDDVSMVEHPVKEGERVVEQSVVEQSNATENTIIDGFPSGKEASTSLTKPTESQTEPASTSTYTIDLPPFPISFDDVMKLDLTPLTTPTATRANTPIADLFSSTMTTTQFDSSVPTSSTQTARSTQAPPVSQPSTPAPAQKTVSLPAMLMQNAFRRHVSPTAQPTLSGEAIPSSTTDNEGLQSFVMSDTSLGGMDIDTADWLDLSLIGDGDDDGVKGQGKVKMQKQTLFNTESDISQKEQLDGMALDMSLFGEEGKLNR